MDINPVNRPAQPVPSTPPVSKKPSLNQRTIKPSHDIHYALPSNVTDTIGAAPNNKRPRSLAGRVTSNPPQHSLSVKVPRTH